MYYMLWVGNNIGTADGLALAGAACVALQKLKNCGVVLAPSHSLFGCLRTVRFVLPTLRRVNFPIESAGC